MEKEQLIYKKIPEIMKKVGVIGKEKSNTQQHYKFRGIDDMYNHLSPLLAEHGVFVTSEILKVERETRQTNKGGTLLYVYLTIRFRFYAEDGSYIETTKEGEAMDSGDKGSNKAMSTALKYAYMETFCIRTEELKDNEDKVLKKAETIKNTAVGNLKDELKKLGAENMEQANGLLAKIMGNNKKLKDYTEDEAKKAIIKVQMNSIQLKTDNHDNTKGNN